MNEIIKHIDIILKEKYHFLNMGKLKEDENSVHYYENKEELDINGDDNLYLTLDLIYTGRIEVTAQILSEDNIKEVMKGFITLNYLKIYLEEKLDKLPYVITKKRDYNINKILDDREDI